MYNSYDGAGWLSSAAFEEYRWNVWNWWWNSQQILASEIESKPKALASPSGARKISLHLLTGEEPRRDVAWWKKTKGQARQQPNTKKSATTLMLRNIPNKYCQREMLEDLEASGFCAGEHMDFFYLPIDPLTGANLGYAFINMQSKELTEKFRLKIDQTQLPRHLTRKVVEVGLASVQGFEENRKYYASSSSGLHPVPARRPLFWNKDKEAINVQGEVIIETESEPLEGSIVEQDWVSTLMLRNLRNKFTQTDLLHELSQLGFQTEESIDFFYLPIDTSTNANLGYAFVNFTSPDLVDNFRKLSTTRLSKIFKKNKVIVDEASVQGIQANWDLYTRSAPINSSDPNRRPLFWSSIPLRARSEAWESTDASRRLTVMSGSSKAMSSGGCEKPDLPPGLKAHEVKRPIEPPPGLAF